MKTEHEEIVRANRAREVLENPIFQESLQTLRNDIEQQWRTSPARDAEGREHLWVMQKLLTRIVGHLEQTMLTGRMAAETLRSKEANEDRARAFEA